MRSVDAVGAADSLNEDGERLLQLIRAEVAQLDLPDPDLVAALERHVGAAVAEVFPADRPTRPGDLVLTEEESGRVTLAVVTGALAETQIEIEAKTETETEGGGVRARPVVRRVADLRTRELLRLALGPRRPRGKGDR